MLPADLIPLAARASDDALRWADLGLRQGFEIFGFEIRYYSLAYLVGILAGYWLLTRMATRPGSPVTREQVDSIVLGVILGIVLGGRLGYAAFYDPALFTSLDLFKPWEGGMSFHGGLIGVLVAVGIVCWRERISPLRGTDYVAVVVPIGMMLGRLANFINGELWGRETDVPWGMIFPTGGEVVRHPSQLYQALGEGLIMILVMSWAFWRTGSRWYPGLLAGIFALGTGLARFVAEFFREPDSQLKWLQESTGVSMGQWLTVPLMLAGLALVWWALRHPPVRDTAPDDERD